MPKTTTDPKFSRPMTLNKESLEVIEKIKQHYSTRFRSEAVRRWILDFPQYHPEYFVDSNSQANDIAS